MADTFLVALFDENEQDRIRMLMERIDDAMQPVNVLTSARPTCNTFEISLQNALRQLDALPDGYGRQRFETILESLLRTGCGAKTSWYHARECIFGEVCQAMFHADRGGS